MKTTQESAVSPVVGVMLMLVVVIIIAAVVSGFAGSLVGTSTKPPQATIQGKYSYSANMLSMFHAGGDELSTKNLVLTFRENDADFAGYSSMFKGSGGQNFGIMNKSKICTVTGECWLNAANGQTSGVSIWRPGETMYFNGTSQNFEVTDVVGRSMILELDTTDGKLVSKTKVMIDP
jgi:archaeal type IV pilus assembly protein PilA